MLVTGGYENVKLTFICRLRHYELVSVTVRNLFYPLDTARAAVYDIYLTIRSSVFCYANNQQDALYRLIYYSKSALHVSGDVFARHQEHLLYLQYLGSVHPSCCRLVSPRDTSRQQLG